MVKNHPKWILLTLVVITILLTRPTGSRASQLAQSAPVTPSELILAMNTLRVSNGLPALIEDPIINAVAQITAETMAASNMSWHIGDVRGRLAAAGYGGGATVWATENFAAGNMGIDQIMQMWADPDHMRPAVNPAYCHVGAGVAQAADGRYYYILQAAYTSEHACGEYVSVVNDPSNSANVEIPVSQIIIPVKVAEPDAEGRVYHVVKAGQSFWSIAIAYGITIQDIETWNNLSRENSLFVGQKLFIPTENTAGYATPTPVGMVNLASPDAEGRIIHEVQPYQTLTRIAKAYEVSLERILTLNGIQADWPLQIGQKLLIYPGNVTPSPTPRPLTAIERLTPASDGKYYHTVSSGEYLAWIAQFYEVSLNDLLNWNGLTINAVIRPGQQLLLQVTPPATETPTPLPPSATPTLTATRPTATTSQLQASTSPTPFNAEITADSTQSRPVIPIITAVLAGLAVFGWLIWQAYRGQSPNQR